MARRPGPSGWHIGVIGGSGLAALDALDHVQEIAVASPFGAPSGPVVMGELGGVKVTFLARHGAGHTIPPGEVNYRANIDVLKRCGVTDVLAISAVGSLREELAPGAFVAVDQIVDTTSGRASSFFTQGIVAHVGLAIPFCTRLNGLAAQAAEAVGAQVTCGGTYIAIDGPQFSTRAQSELYRAWGGAVIGMTAMPEARLAREAELPYALLAMVTDFDAWREGDPSTAGEIVACMQANAALAQGVVRALVNTLPRQRSPSPADTALDGAIVTPRAQWDPALRTRLDAVARRLLRKTPGG